jgi:hypothetical protein
MKTLNDLFLNELADMHEAERRIVKALPKMAKAATRSHLESRGRNTDHGRRRPRRPGPQSVPPDTGPEQFLNFW